MILIIFPFFLSHRENFIITSYSGIVNYRMLMMRPYSAMLGATLTKAVHKRQINVGRTNECSLRHIFHSWTWFGFLSLWAMIFLVVSVGLKMNDQCMRRPPPYSCSSSLRPTATEDATQRGKTDCEQKTRRGNILSSSSRNTEQNRRSRRRTTNFVFVEVKHEEAALNSRLNKQKIQRGRAEAKDWIDGMDGGINGPHEWMVAQVSRVTKRWM